MKRIQAGSLLATRLLLPANAAPTHIVAVGAGAQIQAHLSLFLAAYPSIKSCVVVNRSENARVLALRDHLLALFPLVDTMSVPLSQDPEKHNTLKDAINNASVIITATSSTESLFPSEWVRAGAHLCLIGSYKPEMSARSTRTLLTAADENVCTGTRLTHNW